MSTLPSSNAPDSVAASTATAILTGIPATWPPCGDNRCGFLRCSIGGDKDGPTVWGSSAIARFPQDAAASQGSHILENCGHWIQQEKSDEVNGLLMDFLAEVRPI